MLSFILTAIISNELVMTEPCMMPRGDSRFLPYDGPEVETIIPYSKEDHYKYNRKHEPIEGWTKTHKFTQKILNFDTKTPIKKLTKNIKSIFKERDVSENLDGLMKLIMMLEMDKTINSIWDKAFVDFD